MRRHHLLFLKDMLEAIDRIGEFVEGMGFEQFASDDRTLSAVLRKIEIVGEAAKNIPASVRERYDGIPWSRLAKMRDKLTHGYFSVDEEIVWKVATRELPELRSKIVEAYRRESGEG